MEAFGYLFSNNATHQNGNKTENGSNARKLTSVTEELFVFPQLIVIEPLVHDGWGVPAGATVRGRLAGRWARAVPSRRARIGREDFVIRGIRIEPAVPHAQHQLRQRDGKRQTKQNRYEYFDAPHQHTLMTRARGPKTPHARGTITASKKVLVVIAKHRNRSTGGSFSHSATSSHSTVIHPHYILLVLLLLLSPLCCVAS